VLQHDTNKLRLGLGLVSIGRLGSFLSALPPERRLSLRIMTKTEKHWNDHTGSPFVDHGMDALKRNIDRSISLLA
jgi:hypothetical protein